MVDVSYGDPRLPQRYWDKVYPCPISGCWLWGGSHKERGYGQFRLENRPWMTHRLMFSIAHGYLPKMVCHRCDTPACVNPDHLFPGDAIINNADMYQKGRYARGERCWMTVLTDDIVREIILLKNTNITQEAVGAKFGIEQSHVSQIWYGKLWTHLHDAPDLSSKLDEPVRRARPAACKRGHPFTPENTRLRPNGTRNCRTCARADGQRRSEKARQSRLNVLTQSTS